jgi:hypothetical protein
MYLATPDEIAQRLRETANGRGDTILFEDHTWSNRAMAAGGVERVPKKWYFSLERVEEILAKHVARNRRRLPRLRTTINQGAA